MTSAARSPRPEQIDELTRGLDLPFASLQQEHLEVISEVLALAWSDLLQSCPTVLLTGSESEVNALMETRLCALLDEHVLWAQLVRSVSRGKETVSFDGGHLEKRPDLSIHLSARNPSFPLVVECKLIDTSSGKGQDLYCKKGLARFLSGEYGWATREAVMLAYVRDRSTIASCLTPLLTADLNRSPSLYAVAEPPAAICLGTLDLALSRHGRNFRYPDRTAPHDDPGDISLWHLWLN